jgi:DNA-binding NarL/FixJ family response regulator
MRVLLATDRPDLGSALSLFLSDRQIDVVGVIADAYFLHARAASVQADVVLLDWHLGRTISTQAVADLTRGDAPIPVIVLASSQEQGPARASGAAAYATLGDPPDDLLAALHEVARATS